MRLARGATSLAALAALALAGAAAADSGGGAPADSGVVVADSSAAVADSSRGTAPADSSAAPADSADALDRYLQGLERRTPVTVPVDRFPTAAEVDSVLATWKPGVEPGQPAAKSGWRFGLGLGEARFNRVEGVDILPEAAVTSPGDRLLLTARGGFGWSSREPAWRAAVRVGPLTVSHAREVYAYGSGGMPGNSVLALAAGKDWNDWYRAKGWMAQAVARAGRFDLTVGGSAQYQESLANATDFTLFEGDRAFRPNPPIDDGSVRWVHAILSGGNAEEGRLAGTVVTAVAGGGLGGDFAFNRTHVELVGRQRLWLGDEAKVRLTAGEVRGDPPFQSLFHLGGTKTLRGYDVNELAARRFVHLALDYKLGTDVLAWVPFVRRLRLQPVPFLDAAGIFRLQERDGTEVVPPDPLWRFSTGVGLLYNPFGIPGGAGQVRLDAARRLDRSRDATTYRLGFTIER